MHPNWLGVISAVLALAAFSVTYHRTRALSTRTRLRLTLLAMLAALPGASFAAYYLHLLQEPAWYKA